jgi:hypothetical protein
VVANQVGITQVNWTSQGFMTVTFAAAPGNASSAISVTPILSGGDIYCTVTATAATAPTPELSMIDKI